MTKRSVPPLVAIFLFVALPVVLIDQLTKFWALNSLQLNAPKKALLGDWIGLQLIRNPGAAFSLGPGYAWVFSIVAVVVVVVISYTGRQISSRIWQFSLGLLGGGALGNLIDRLIQPPQVFRGHVVDFLNYHSLFIGNVADIAIVIGVVLVVILVVLGISTSRRQPRRH